MNATTTNEAPAAGTTTVRQDGRFLGTIKKDRYLDSMWSAQPFKRTAKLFSTYQEAFRYIEHCATLPPERFIVIDRDDCWGESHNFRDCVHAELQIARDREPIAVLQTFVGTGAAITPAQLRELAARLINIAEDAENQKTGPRSFHPSYRRY